MAVKILLAVLAAFCTLQALNALPQPHHAVDADRDRDLKGIDLSNIIQKAQALLDAIEEKVIELGAVLLQKGRDIAQKIEKQVQQLADKIKSTVQEWIDKAQAAGVNAKDCLAQQNSLDALIANLRQKSNACVKEQLRNVQGPINEVKALIPQAQQLLIDTTVAVNECLQSGSVSATLSCIAQKVNPLVERASKLCLDFATKSAQAALQISTVGPLATKCMAGPLNDAAQQSTGLVNEIISCIKEKMATN